jgi:hypothetical protein
VAIQLTDVRFAVQDQPRPVGIAPETPRLLGVADGVTTTFYLPLRGWQYVANSLVPYYLAAGASPPPTGFANSGNTAYVVNTTQPSGTTSPTAQIVFSIAPGAGTSGIPSGAQLLGSYQAVGFSDSDLTNVLTRNQGKYSLDDQVIKGCQLDVIDVLLMNHDLMAIIREAEYTRDPNGLIAGYEKQYAKLKEAIEGIPRPGKAVPFMMAVQSDLSDYTPSR